MTTNKTSQPGKLPALTIHAIDVAGHKGLGTADLKDPERSVALSTPVPNGVYPGDIVELYWNGEVIQAFELPYSERTTIDFLVPPDDIPDEPTPAEVFYCITNREWGFQMWSAVREVEVKRYTPGGPDANSFTPAHNESLPPPEGLPEYIGPDATEQTLYIEPWSLMEEGDVLTLYWGSQAHSVSNPPLTADEVGTPQTIVVGMDLLQEAGDNEHLTVAYDITDRVGNWSLFSIPAYTEVRMTEDSPAAPMVAGLDSQSALDLDSLEGQDLTVRIPAYEGIRAKDRITLYFVGNSGADWYAIEAGSQSVSARGFAPEFVLAYSDVAASLNFLFELYYIVQPLSGPPRVSSSLVIQINGQLPHLEPPVVDNAAFDTLDPAQALESDLLVRVKPYQGKNLGDVIYLRWEGWALDFTPIVYCDEYSVGQGEEQLDTVFAPIPPYCLLALAGSTLKLSYSVELYDGFLTESEPAFYAVVSTENLPAPEVDALQNDVLDPDLNTAGTYVRINGTSAVLRRGDDVNITWKGTLGSGSHSASLKVSSDNQNLKLYIDKLRVEANRNQSVEVSYRVKRASGSVEQVSEPLTLYVTSSQTLALPAPQVLQAVDNVLSPLDATNGVTVQVSYSGMKNTDQLSLSWNGSDTVATPLNQPGHSSGSVSFRIPANQTSPSNSRIINVQYRVTRAGKVLTSDPLSLRVADLAVQPQRPQSSPQPAPVPVPEPATDLPNMILDDYIIEAAPDWKRKSTATAASTGFRAGEGGKPPYTYTSSNALVAEVDSSGNVVGHSNGEAIITIRDAANKSRRYRVIVSNLKRLATNEGPLSFTDAEHWRNSIEGSPLTSVELGLIASNYAMPFPLTVGRNYWTGDRFTRGLGYINNRSLKGTIEVVNESAKTPTVTGAICLIDA